MAVGLGEGVAFAASLIMGGCFGIHWPKDVNPCIDGQDKIVECTGTDTFAGSGADDLTCEGNTLCVFECINDAECPEIQALFTGGNVDPNSPLLLCITGCSGVSEGQPL